MADRAKSAVVTGVSSGIGRAIAACLLDDGWQVFGSARNEQDAAAAKEALGAAFTPLVFDVTDGASIAAAASHVNDALAGKTLDGLVNNAGIATARPLRYVPIDDLERQFDVNVYGVVRTCQAFLPLLGADRKRTGKPGKIVSISSLAGRVSVPFLSPYSMSKHAVEAMSDAMRVELLPHGMRIGLSNTHFLPHGAPNIALDACVSVFEGGARRLSVDSAAESRPSWAHTVGYPWSPARFRRSRELSDAADPSVRGRRAA